MSAMGSQIASVSIVCSTVCSGADQRKHQSSASLAFVRGIHRWPVNSPHKGPVTRKMFPFDDVIVVASEMDAGQYSPFNDFLFLKFSILRNPDGTLLKEGDLAYDAEFADTLESIADNPEGFYTGTLAQDIVEDVVDCSMSFFCFCCYSVNFEVKIFILSRV